MRSRRDAGPILGGAALAATVVLLGAVVARAALSGGSEIPLPAPAVDAASTDAGTPSTRFIEAVQDGDSESFVSSEVVAMAAERAPFSPNRRPSDPYLLPDERRPDPEPRRRVELPDPPDFEVLGIVQGADGSIVVMRADDDDDEPLYLLELGEQLEGYRVASVDDGRVVMEGQGQTVNLSVLGPRPTVRRSRDRDDDRRRRGDDDDDDDDDRRRRGGEEQLSQVYNQAMEMLQSGSFNPAALMQMRGLIQRAGVDVDDIREVAERFRWSVDVRPSP